LDARSRGNRLLTARATRPVPNGGERWLPRATRRESGLAFLYQEQKADGSDSTFFKLVNR
jgi:hypothetical protein